MKDHIKNKHKNGMFELGTQWVPVTTEDAHRDWVQIGKKNKTLGRSHLKLYKKYPSWGDKIKKSKKQKKTFCYVTGGKQVEKAKKAKKSSEARVAKKYIKTRGACMRADNKQPIDDKLKVPVGQKDNIEKC